MTGQLVTFKNTRTPPRGPCAGLLCWCRQSRRIRQSPGEIEKAWGDNWVDAAGNWRAFIGKVRANNGTNYDQSLFVVEIPANTDITTADSGASTRFPTPPDGVQVRRLTTSWADGIVRCHPGSHRIAYYGGSPDAKQIFVIPLDGMEEHPDPAKRPIQLTHFQDGVTGGLRWHSSGNAVAYIVNNGIAVTSVEPGAKFGKTTFLTPCDNGPERRNLVWSHDGRTLAYNKRTPTSDAEGNSVTDDSDRNTLQIFLVEYTGTGR